MKYFSKIGAAALLACGLLSAGAQAQTSPPAISASAQSVFDLALELYPDLFANGGDLKETQGYVYRLFADSGIYVGIKDGNLYLKGGPFGSAIVNKGPVTSVLAVLEDLKDDVNVPAPTADVQALFDAAAELYPSIFMHGSDFMTSADGYLYRFFVDSGVYVGIKNGAVFLKGGAFGNFYTSRGSLNAVLDALEDMQGGEIPNIPEGDYTLTVSGTVAVLGTSSPFSIVFEDMPAPDTSDVDDIKDAFLDSLNTTGVTITNFTFVVVNNTANHIEFDVSATATTTTQGLTFSYTYNLKYNYVK